MGRDYKSSSHNVPPFADFQSFIEEVPYLQRQAFYISIKMISAVSKEGGKLPELLLEWNQLKQFATDNIGSSPELYDRICPLLDLLFENHLTPDMAFDMGSGELYMAAVALYIDIYLRVG
jgi:hypothetical protein